MTGLPPGGSVPSGGGHTMPGGMYRCCDNMDLKHDGERSCGCCTYYRCANCGKRILYEWPD